MYKCNMAQMPIPFLKDDNCPTFREFLSETFWPDKANLRYLTLRGYKSDVKLRLMPAFENIRLDEIDYSAIQRMLNSCPTYKAAKKAKDTLSAILGHAVRTRKLFFNPAVGQFVYPDKIHQRENPLGEWLTNFSQIAYVLNEAREFDPGGEIEKICLLGFGSGLRNGEIFGVDGKDFDLDRGTLFVHQSFTRAGENGPQMHGVKTEASVREIPLFTYVIKRIKEIGLVDGPFVTYNNKRSNPGAAANRFRAFRELRGLPNITIATMRHSFATSMIRAGIPVPILQQWLGHSTSSTTLNRYCRPQVGDLRYDAKMISEILDSDIKGSEPLFDTVTYSEQKTIHSFMTKDSHFIKDIEGQLKPALKPKLQDQIEELLKENPKITRKEIAEKLNRPPQIIKESIDLLHKTGKLTYR